LSPGPDRSLVYGPIMYEVRPPNPVPAAASGSAY